MAEPSTDQPLRSGTAAPPTPEPVRVITFNTAVGNPRIKTDQRDFLKLPFYQEIIRGSPEAAILAAQEVGPEQAKALKAAADDGQFRLIHIQRPGQGNAILAPKRFRVMTHRSRYFFRGQVAAALVALRRWIGRAGKPNLRQLAELRMWSEARVRDERSGAVFSVFNTHLSGDPLLRVEQAKDLFKQVHRARRQGSVILAGDLNARADESPDPAQARADEAVRALFGDLRDMAASARDSRRPPIDYVLAAGFSSLSARLYTGDSLQLPGLPTADLISDHYAKEAVLRLD